MRIIISSMCESITGSLGSGFGYHIQRRKNGFFGKRNTKGDVPHDGHWRFILACANLAKMSLHISDVEVDWQELSKALYEAYHFQAAYMVDKNARSGKKLSYNAKDVINLKNTFGL